MTSSTALIDWEHQIRLHRDWMAGLAFARLGDPHEAEDVIQEISLMVVSEQPALRDPSGVRSWLYQVLIRRVADCLRTRYRQERMKSGYASRSTCQTESSGDAWDWLLAKEQRSLLKDALSNLPEREREIIVLKFVHNWTYSQLGKRFNLSDRAVEYCLVRAKEQLRSSMTHQQRENA